jgi:Fe-S-cluster-containing hydrogenase component 2
MAGIRAAYELGFCKESETESSLEKCAADLNSLRQGMFASGNKGKLIEKTEEDIPVSMNLLTKGFVADGEISRFPGVTRQKGIHPVIECTQNIPCNPCQDACAKHCIRIGSHITSLPVVENPSSCTGCGLCVASCSGQAIFLVNENNEPGFASVTMPYEFLPLPEKGDKGKGLGRDGKPVCDAEIIDVKSLPAFDHTNLVTMKVPAECVMKARFFKAV